MREPWLELLQEFSERINSGKLLLPLKLHMFNGNSLKKENIIHAVLSLVAKNISEALFLNHSIFLKSVKHLLIENRHQNCNLQREYDKRYGLIKM